MARYHMKLGAVRVLEKKQAVPFVSQAVSTMENWANHHRRMGEIHLADWLDECCTKLSAVKLKGFTTINLDGPVNLSFERIS